MADIFISYKREKRVLADTLAGVLRLHGWSAWLDVELEDAGLWRRQLTIEHGNAHCVVVLWCSESVNSDFVRDEAARAQRVDALIPVRVEGVEPPLGFGELECVDLVGWSHGIDRLGPLIDAIQIKIGSPGHPTRKCIRAETSALELRRNRGSARGNGLGGSAPSPIGVGPGPHANFRDTPRTPEMVWIRPGKFRLGSPADEPDRSNSEGPRKVIELQKAFYISKDPVTLKEWMWLCGQHNRDLHLPDVEYHLAFDCPVVDISWYDAVKFCDRLSDIAQRRYRLPSEAEWEYVCRAGQEGAFGTGETISPEQGVYCWRVAYRNGRTEQDVKQRAQPVDHPRNFVNAFGVRGMHGNVWEWVADAWWHNHVGLNRDGTPRPARSTDADRVVKGGCWASSPKHLRSAFRGRWNPSADFWLNQAHPTKGRDRIGFRVVCEP